MTTEVIQNETSVKIAALNDEHRRNMQGCTDENLKNWCDPLDKACRRVLTVMLAEEY